MSGVSLGGAPVLAPAKPTSDSNERFPDLHRSRGGRTQGQLCRISTPDGQRRTGIPRTCAGVGRLTAWGRCGLAASQAGCMILPVRLLEDRR